MLIEQVTHGLENLQVILPADISPTRKTVLDSKYLNAIVGGMNFFASDPVDSNTEVIDSIVSQYGDALSVPTDKETVINLLQLVGSYDSQDFQVRNIFPVFTLCAQNAHLSNFV